MEMPGSQERFKYCKCQLTAPLNLQAYIQAIVLTQVISDGRQVAAL